MTEVKNKTSYISIPQKLIHDKNKEVNVKAKYLYITLKKHSVKDKVNIRYNTLMNSLQWTDKRILKKYLDILKNNRYINYEFDVIHKYISIEIIIVGIKPFIMMARDIVEQALSINVETVECKPRSKLFWREKSILYLYLMEDKFNNEWGYSCPNRKEIESILSSNNIDTKKIIDYCHENMICEYNQGIIVNADSGKVQRSRNRYLPNNKDKDGKLRYQYHKSIEYFFSSHDEYNKKHGK